MRLPTRHSSVALVLGGLIFQITHSFLPFEGSISQL